MGVWSRYQVAWSTLLADLYAAVGNPERSLAILRRAWMGLGEERAQFLTPRLLRRARLAEQVAAVRTELAELLE